MRIVYLNSDSPYIIGQQGETNAVTLRVDVTEWVTDFPNGTGVILFTRPNKAVYPLETSIIELDGKTYLQTIVTTKENKVPGWVVLQAQWYNGDTLVKSMMFSGKVLVSGDGTPVDTTETVPDWVTEWMTTLQAAIDGAGNLIEAAEMINEEYENFLQSVSNSEAWAKGTRSGEAVEPTDETYHNNSKYYSEQIAATYEDVEAWANGTRGGVDIESDDPAYHKNGKYYNTQAAASASAAAASASEAMTDTPEGYSNVVASISPTYDGTKTYAVGAYCLNGGKLYRCTTAITEAEATFNSAHWAQVNVGSEVADLKSATQGYTEKSDNIFCLAPGLNKDFYTTGFKGITIKKYPDGSVEFNGTSDSANVLLGENVTEDTGATLTAWLPADTYSFGLEIISGTVSSSADSSFSVRAGTTTTVALSQGTKKSVHTFENTAICYIRLGSNIIYNKFRVKIMINSGSTLKDYVPHITAYDYISRENISELFKISEDTYNIFYITKTPQTINDVTITLQADGTYLFNGTASATIKIPVMGVTDKSIAVLPSGPYSFGWKKVSGSQTVNVVTDFGLRIGGESASDTVVREGADSRTFTYQSNSTAIIYIKEGTILNNYNVKISINSGSLLLPFVPHGITAIDYIARSINDKITESVMDYPVSVGNAAYRCQGCCLNGNLFIWLLYNSQGAVVMHSVNVTTGVHSGKTLDSTTEVLGHCQDITYNNTEDAYYVNTMLDSGAVVKLDNEFNYVSTVYPVDENDDVVVASGIAYDRLNDQYILAGQNDFNFYVYDNAWQYVDTIVPQTDTEQAVRQGIDTDGYYIYRTRTSGGGATAPHIRTYSMYGDYLGEYDIFQKYGEEIEGIAYDWENKVFYINTNSKDESKTNIYLVTPNNLPYHGINLAMFNVKKVIAT